MPATPQPRLFMFDAYGTLFDVHSAVLRAGAPLGTKASDVSALWRQKQLEYSWTLTAMGRAEGADFWQLTTEALDWVLARLSMNDPALRMALLDAYRKLDTYPDVQPMLMRLRSAGQRTAIFTNGTAAMVEDAIAAARLGNLIDHVLTVEGTGHFKPHPAVYAHAMRAAGIVNPAAVTFISSNRWDIAGAKQAKLHSIWINRTGQPDEYMAAPPDKTIPDLKALDFSAPPKL
ncbi:COG1011 Predicted hydrolase (HAD superfamily) [Rhabdaerophilaceae bacterium]